MKSKSANKIGLQYKIIILFFSSFIIPIIIFGSTLLFSFRKILENNLYVNQITSLLKFKDGFDKYLIDFDRISRTLSYDIQFSRKLSLAPGDFFNEADYERHREFILEEISGIVEDNPDILSILLFTDAGIVFPAGKNVAVSEKIFSESEWFRDIKEGKARAILLNPLDEEIIPFATNIKITYLQEKSIRNGVLIFLLKKDFIDQLLTRRYEFVDTLFLFDRSGNLIYSSNDEIVVKILPTKLIEMLKSSTQGNFRLEANAGSHTLISFITSRFDNIKIISSAPDGKIQNDLRVLKRVIMFFLIIIGILFIFFIFLFSRSISRPIDNLDKIMSELEKSNYDCYRVYSNTKHFGLLDNYFNHLIEILNSMIMRINEHHKKEKEHELLILQSQINPHFINNSLNAIRTMADIKGEHELAHAVRSLIHLLQSSIRIGQIFITVKDEVAQIKDYMYLQSLRYTNMFTVRYDVDPSSFRYKTLKFILQPIVENAVFHGITAMQSGGEILIEIKKVNGRIEYTISDNGVGMTQERIEKLLKSERRDDQVDRIGMVNVNLRLIKYFGEGSGLKVQSGQGKGTTVRYSIPAEN